MLAQLKRSGVPVDGMGIQSHYSANPGAFPSKESAHFTMDRLKVRVFFGAHPSWMDIEPVVAEPGLDGRYHRDGLLASG